MTHAVFWDCWFFFLREEGEGVWGEGERIVERQSFILRFRNPEVFECLNINYSNEKSRIDNLELIFYTTHEKKCCHIIL